MEQLTFLQRRGPRLTLQRNQGFVLAMAVIVLLVMTLSALAMMKLMGAGVMTAGNIAFRQAAVRVADLALEDANTWIKSQTAASLQNDAPSNGYYASNDPTFAPQNFRFTDAGAAKQYSSGGNDTFSGYKIYYVIHRMALTAGVACADPSAACATPVGATASVTGAGSSHLAGAGYQAGISGTTGLVYYRVTAKVVGPRFNNSYVQSFLY